MATRSFVINTEPHVAEVGTHRLLFVPEAMGDEFVDAYAELQETYKRLHIDDEQDAAGVDPSVLREANTAARDFLKRFMLPESAAEFNEVQLPHRVLGELTQWVMELYGGERPPTSSPASAASRRSGGTRSTGSSRSRVSTSMRGR